MSSRILPGLESLSLNFVDNPIGEAGIIATADALLPDIPELRLQLARCRVGEELCLTTLRDSAIAACINKDGPFLVLQKDGPVPAARV